MRNAGSMGTAGTYNVPGLPALAGAMQGVVTDEGKATGVFTYQRTALLNLSTSGNAKQTGIFSLNPHSIFGASNTVMPASADVVVGLYLGRSA